MTSIIATILGLWNQIPAKVKTYAVGLVVFVTLMFGSYVQGCNKGKASMAEALADKDKRIYSLEHAPPKITTEIKYLPAIPQKPVQIARHESHDSLRATIVNSADSSQKVITLGIINAEGKTPVKLIGGGANGDTTISIGYQASVISPEPISLTQFVFDLLPFEVPYKTIKSETTVIQPLPWYYYLDPVFWFVRFIEWVFTASTTTTQ